MNKVGKEVDRRGFWFGKNTPEREGRHAREPIAHDVSQRGRDIPSWQGMPSWISVHGYPSAGRQFQSNWVDRHEHPKVVCRIHSVLNSSIG